MTPTGSSTPLPGSNVQHQQQINAAMAAFQAMQQHDLLNGQQQQQQQHSPHHQFHHQSQQAAAVAAAQHHAAAVAAANHAAGQMVGRQGAIKDVRSIIEDYRQRHPETVPKRGRRMKTVPIPTTNASLMNASGSSLMMMQMMASNNCNVNSDSVVDLGGFELSVGGGGGSVGQGGGCGVIKASSPGLGGDGGGSASAALASNEEGSNSGKIATARSVPMAGKSKLNAGKIVGKEKDRRIGSGILSGRGSEWQVMLTSDSGPGLTTAAPPVLSRPSSAESSHSNASASAINSILTQHGLLPAISVTSIGGGGSSSAGAETGSGGGRGGGGGRGSVNGNFILSFF